jgi:hypothetical protein
MLFKGHGCVYVYASCTCTGVVLCVWVVLPDIMYHRAVLIKALAQIINTIMITHDDLRDREHNMRTRVVDFAHSIPRFRKVLSNKRWKLCQNFSVNNHLFFHIVDGKNKNVMGKVSDLISTHLDPDLPLWRVDVVQDSLENKHVLLIRVHHVIGDGLALIGLLHGLLRVTTEDPKTFKATTTQFSFDNSEAAQNAKQGTPLLFRPPRACLTSFFSPSNVMQ